MKSPAVLCIALLFAWAQAASAIDVVESQTFWGFDGQAQLRRFVPLTIEVDNPSPDPAEVTLTLHKHLHQGAGGRVDARLVERRVYLGPYSRRIVQFYPYTSEHVTWSVSWGRGIGQRKELPTPRFTAVPARVVLTRGNNIARQSTGLRQMPEEFFPPVVTATETLGAVILDHVPRWDEEARRQAFLDWLHLGGQLHLFHDDTGQFPAFTGTLALLNSPLEQQPIGSGMVHRHGRTIGELDSESFQNMFLPQAAPTQTGNGTPLDGMLPDRPAGAPPASSPTVDVNGQQLQAATYAAPPNYFLSHDQYNIDEASLLALRKMSSPDHNWALLHAMCWVYCFAVVGSYIVAWRWDYRTMMITFLLTVAAFSFGFAHIGRRGYGEVTASHSIGIARPAADGAWNVLQWNNVFVTSGDFYRLTHDGTGGLYSTAQEMEAVNGFIDSGVEGSFEVDIPPFSSRGFVSRARIKADPLDATIQNWDPAAGLGSLVIKLGEHFPAETYAIYAVAGNHYAMLARQEDKLRAAGTGAFSQLVRLRESPDQYRSRMVGFFQADDQPTSTREQYFDSLIPAVIARSFDIRTQHAADTFLLPEDRVRLLVLVQMPERFFVNSQFESEQDGRLLYAVDLPLPEKP